MRVIGDQNVSRLQDTLAGTVVLLQLDHLQRREIFLQQHQVLRPRAAPGVDRLVVVTHHGKARAVAHQQLNQLVLTGVGILVLIYQQIANTLLPAFAHLFVALQQQRRQQDQVVEVQHVARPHMGVVQAVAVGEQLVALRARQLRRPLRIDQVVFPVGDGRDQLRHQRFVAFQPLFGQLFQ